MIQLPKKIIFLLTGAIFCLLILNCCTGSKKSKTPPPVVTPPPPPPPPTLADRDGDGIPDSDDKCPDLKGTARYEGCPIPDTDGDGVNDEEDRCIDEKGPLYNFGCPVIADEKISQNTPPPPIKINIKKDITTNPIKSTDELPIDNVKKTDNKVANSDLPDAQLVYSFRQKMVKDETIDIMVLIQLNKSAAELLEVLKSKIVEKADIGKNDSTIRRNISHLKGYRQYKVILESDDKEFFEIVSKMPGTQTTDTSSKKASSWLFRVKALKESPFPKNLDIKVFGISDNGIDTIDIQTIPISISLLPKPSSVWPTALLVGGGVLLLGLAALLIWKRKKVKKPNTDIYFSYAWGKGEDLIVDLYDSLQKDNFKVKRDKNDFAYQGLISGFMNEIGSSNHIIIGITDKYLKSSYCMYELYEIYNSSARKSDAFLKKIFPIRIEEELDLGSMEVVNSYVQYWEKKREELDKEVLDNSDSITPKQMEKVHFVRRLVPDLGDILTFLADINSSALKILTTTDFKEVKTALRNSIKKLEKES